MIVVVLICTLIGWLVGAPVDGLIAGLVIWALTLVGSWWNV